MSAYGGILARTLPRLREAVAAAADRSGRREGDVRIVAVTKGHPVEAVEAALDHGLDDIGENRVGELEAKVAALGEIAQPRWHMIGHVQRRKVPRLLPLSHLIHSVDSVRLARRLDAVVRREGGGEGASGTEPATEDPVRVLVQVNTSGEASKYGFSPDAFSDAMGEMLELPGIRVEGLMTMAPFDADESVVRATFSRLRRLHDDARSWGSYQGTELSMGMSNDYGVAVEEGSTMIRIGTALFGERDT